MSFSHNVTFSVRRGGDDPVSETLTFSASSEANFDETIAVGTDTVLNIAIDVSAVKSFFIVSDRAVTIETNNGGSPTNTLTLAAGVPYVWNTSSADTFKLTGDVTKYYVTNASGGSARIQQYCIQDSTP